MKRSVIQLAGRTLLVSLPAKWADLNHVKKGDELELTEDGHKLVVTSERKMNLESAELDADTVGDLIKRYIFALYKKGVDEIDIKYSDPKVADIIRDTILNETVGYEIVSQTPKSCIVKLITSGNITEFDSLLRRTFLILLSMAEEIVTSLKGNNFEHLSKSALLEEPNNRLTTVCRRSLNKWGAEGFNKVGPIYYIVEELENIADEYHHFCINLYNLRNSQNKSLRPESLSVMERTNTMLRLFYETFYKFDKAKLNEMSAIRKKIVEDAHKMVETKKMSAADYYVVHHGVSIVERIYCMTGPVLVLNN